MPFYIEPEEKMPAWAGRSYKVLEEQIPLRVGVTMREAFVLHAQNVPSQLPWYADMTRLTVRTNAQDPRVPNRYAGALHFHAPVVEMERYLVWLQNEVSQMLKAPVLTDIPQVYSMPSSGDLPSNVVGENNNVDTKSDSDVWSLLNIAAFAKQEFGSTVLVNCTGFGAKRLCNDDKVKPGRGVLLFGKRTEGHDKFDYCISECDSDGFESHDGMLAYAFPRGDNRITLGGTIQMNDDRVADSAEIAGIRDRVGRLVPCIENVEESSRWAGLRPLRTGGVRLEKEYREDLGLTVVHNYGHGGGGVTTSWGCADEVVELIQA